MAARDLAIVCPARQPNLLGLEPIDRRYSEPLSRVVVHSLGQTSPDTLPRCSTEQKWLTLVDDGTDKLS